MKSLMALTAPLLIAAGLIAAGRRNVDAFQALTEGSRKGLDILRDMFPALLVLLPALKLLQCSGLPEMLAPLLNPLLRRLGIPPETGLLLLLRPFSAHRGGNAGLQRDHLLCRRRLSGRGGSAPQPLGDPGGPLRGSGLLCLLSLDLPPALGIDGKSDL